MYDVTVVGCGAVGANLPGTGANLIATKDM